MSRLHDIEMSFMPSWRMNGRGRRGLRDIVACEQWPDGGLSSCTVEKGEVGRAGAVYIPAFGQQGTQKALLAAEGHNIIDMLRCLRSFTSGSSPSSYRSNATASSITEVHGTAGLEIRVPVPILNLRSDMLLRA